jgi:DNA modification methylase
MTVTVLTGDCLDVLKTLPDESVHCCVTSPPYWGLRDYGVPGQIGLEPNPDEFVSNIVDVFREVRRVLRNDGTVWMNMGDSYATGTTSDWYEQDIVGSIESTGSDDWAQKLDAAQRLGFSLRMDFDIDGRDGCFDEDQLFAVWERQDVEALIERLQRTLATG